jgi:drug/metabolite transporter (DMT)-like permease
MFLGSSLQQVGLVTTTAGNAAFITSLYVIIVPFLGHFFLSRKVGAVDWLASLVAVAGLWLITMRGPSFSMSGGDLLVLACAFFWALHIIVIGRFAAHYDPIRLSFGQFLVSGLLSLLVSLFTETTTLEGLRGALVPLLYGGVASCGVAFTLQIFGQRKTKASHASIILALEGLFGALGGILILGEPATARILAGGGLMILATMLPQLWNSLAPSPRGEEGATHGT